MKKYTKKQIVEAIKYWKSVLKRMDENAKNDLLSSLFSLFKANDLLKPFNQCFNVLNTHFFSLKLPNIPLMYKTDNVLRKF